MQIIYGLIIVLMLAGVIGAVVPGVPGTSLILIGIIIWGFVKGAFAAISVPLIVTGIVLLLSMGIDFLAAYWGAKKAGASKWGQIGSMVGLALAFFGLLPPFLVVGGPIIGIFIGPLLGAIIGEFIYRKDLVIAVKAGLGIVVGSLIGNIIQGFLALAAVIVFVFTTWSQVFGA
ncbi:MAG: DUF456 family protein [Cyanobacteria bacterium P01_A01_bin.68]